MGGRQHLDLVGLADRQPHGGGLSVDQHPATLDPFVGLTARTQTQVSQTLVQPDQAIAARRRARGLRSSRRRRTGGGTRTALVLRGPSTSGAIRSLRPGRTIIPQWTVGAVGPRGAGRPVGLASTAIGTRFAQRRRTRFPGGLPGGPFGLHFGQGTRTRGRLGAHRAAQRIGPGLRGAGLEFQGFLGLIGHASIIPRPTAQETTGQRLRVHRSAGPGG